MNTVCPTCKTTIENPTTPLNCVRSDFQKQSIVNEIVAAIQGKKGKYFIFIACWFIFVVQLYIFVGDKKDTATTDHKECNENNNNESKEEVGVILENIMQMPNMKHKIFITCDAETTVEHLQAFVKKSNNIDDAQENQASVPTFLKCS